MDVVDQAVWREVREALQEPTGSNTRIDDVCFPPHRQRTATRRRQTWPGSVGEVRA
jgi:hypothetical protein